MSKGILNEVAVGLDNSIIYNVEVEREKLLAECRVLQGQDGFDFSPQLRLLIRHYKVPIAFVSLLDSTKQYFLVSTGLTNMASVPRSNSYCNLTTLSDAPSVVVMHGDDIPLGFSVPNKQRIQFYAASPIYLDSIKIGTFAMMDTIAHEYTNDDFAFLQTLTETLSEFLEERRAQYLALQPFREMTHSMMNYVKLPLISLTYKASSLHLNFQSYCTSLSDLQRKEMEASLEDFKKSSQLLDEVIRNGLKLCLFQTEYMNNHKKEDYFSLLQSDKYANRMSVALDMEKMFKTILSFTTISDGVYCENIFSYYWNDANIDDDSNVSPGRNSTISSSTDHMSTDSNTHRRRSLSSTMLNMLSSDSHDTKTGLSITTGKDIVLDSEIVWSTLYSILMCQQASWNRVQMSIGVVHAKHDNPISTVLLKFTFMNAKNSEIVLNSEATLLLLSTILENVGGSVRQSEFLADIICQYEVTMPGSIEDQYATPRLATLPDIKYNKFLSHSAPILHLDKVVGTPKALKEVAAIAEESEKSSTEPSVRTKRDSLKSSLSSQGSKGSKGCDVAITYCNTSSDPLQAFESSALEALHEDDQYGFFIDQEQIQFQNCSPTPLTDLPMSAQDSYATLQRQRSSCSQLHDLDLVVMKTRDHHKVVRSYSTGYLGSSVVDVFSNVMTRIKDVFRAHNSTPSPLKIYPTYASENST